MPEAEEPRVAHGERIRCAACGTEQEVAQANETGRCVICSNPLFATTGVAQAKEEAKVFDLGPKEKSSGLAAATAALLRHDPGHEAVAALNELLAADKRLTSWLALVPLWGAWHVQRSAAHTAEEKLRLAALSIFFGLVLLGGLWSLLPSDQAKLDATRARVDAQIGTLAALVQDYARQHRELPDDTVWQRSAASGDLRFYDPWGHLYRYQREEDGFELGTYGRDGVEGGRNEDADVFRHFSAAPPSGAMPAFSSAASPFPPA